MERNIQNNENLKQFLKFTMFSITAGVIELVSFTIFNEFAHFRYWPSYLIALTLSVVYNFTINRRFTFKSAANVPKAMSKVLGYYCIFTPVSTMWGEKLSILGWNEYLILAGTMIINFVTEFLFTRFVVFRNSINTNKIR